jgi:hypothetical protein
MAKKAKGKATSKNLPMKKAGARTVKGGNLAPQQAAALASRQRKTPGGSPAAPVASFIPGLNPVVPL